MFDIEIAKKLKNHPDFKWKDGMLIQFKDNYGLVTQRIEYGYDKSYHVKRFGEIWPCLDDDATIGCLIKILTEQIKHAKCYEFLMYVQFPAPNDLYTGIKWVVEFANIFHSHKCLGQALALTIMSDKYHDEHFCTN